MPNTTFTPLNPPAAAPWAQFALLVEHLTDGVTVQDRNGRIVYANETGARMTGYASMDEFLRAPVGDYVRLFEVLDVEGHPVTIDQLPGRIALREGRAEQLLHVRERATGEERWTEVRSYGVGDRDDDSLFIVNVIRDVTASIQQQRLLAENERRLRAAHDELDQARAVAETASEAKSAFLATMSHELRTPINAILGFTDLLQMGVVGAPSPLQVGYLQRIRRSTEHLLELINDVLDLSKIEAGNLAVSPDVAPAHAVIAEAVSLVRQQALDRGLTLDIDTESTVTYFGDALRVRQILLNLLSNAIKFTSSGGRVHLECSASPNAPDTVTFIVTDTGIGIAPEALDQVFEPFTQADGTYKRTHGGTGLGLTISRRLARMMNGDVCATSTVGVGSRFVLTLPIRAS